MDDVSKLGPLWVNQLRQKVASNRNHASESLMTVNPEGDFAKQHKMLIDAANTMLSATELLAALQVLADEFVRVFPIYYYAEPWAHDRNLALKAARAAIAKATGAA